MSTFGFITCPFLDRPILAPGLERLAPTEGRGLGSLVFALLLTEMSEGVERRTSRGGAHAAVESVEHAQACSGRSQVSESGVDLSAFRSVEAQPGGEAMIFNPAGLLCGNSVPADPLVLPQLGRRCHALGPVSVTPV